MSLKDAFNTIRGPHPDPSPEITKLTQALIEMHRGKRMDTDWLVDKSK